MAYGALYAFTHPKVTEWEVQSSFGHVHDMPFYERCPCYETLQKQPKVESKNFPGEYFVLGAIAPIIIKV